MAAAGGEESREAAARLKAARGRLAALAAEAEQYPPGDPAPYGPAAAEWARRLAAATEAYGEVAQARQELQYWKPGSPQGEARGGLFKLYDRWQAGREARSFFQDLAWLEAQVAEAEEAREQVRRIPLEVAERCGQARAQGDKIAATIGALRAAGLHGDELDRVEAEARALGEGLAGLPGYFLAGSVAQVVRQATKKETIGAARRLAEVAGPLSRLAGQVQGWQGRVEAVGQGLAALRKALARTGEGLAALPPEVEERDLAAALARVEEGAQRLSGEAASTPVGRLADLAQEVASATEEALHLAEEVEQVARLAAGLEARVQGAGRLLGAVRLGMERVVEARIYPLDWGPYLARWERLEEVQDKLAAAGRRPPARLRQDVQRAGELEANLTRLAGEVEEICRQREEIVRLLDGPALGAQAAWPGRARALGAAAGAYAAGNWPAEWDVTQIDADAGALLRARQAALPAALPASRPLAAAMVGDVVWHMRHLASEVAGFERWLEEVAQRLEALQQQEGAAGQALETTQATMDGLAQALEGVRPGSGSRLARLQRRLGKLRRQGEKLRAGWAQPGRGTVEAKAQQQERWQRDNERVAGELAQALGEEVARARAALQEEVAGLQAVARFDLEPAMKAAETLLAGPGRGGQAGRLVLGGQRAPAPQGLQELAAAAGALLEERSRLVMARQALHQGIGQPLEGPRQAWQRARARAQALEAQAAEAQRAAEVGWPPLAVDAGWVEDLLRRARRDEERLPRWGRSVGAAVELLGEIVEGYEQAAGALARKVAEVEADRKALAVPAGRIETWRARLAAYREGQAGDPVVAEAIDGRLAEIEREVHRLRQAWQFAPPSAREAERALEGVVSLAGADLRLGDGRVIRGREVWRGR